MLAGSGVNDDDEVTVGPNKMLTTSDPQGRYYYVEHTGRAIQAGANHLASLEDQMKSYGAEFLKKRPGRETATARALDSSESSSGLQSTTVVFADAIQELYAIAAAWTQGEAGTVEINTEFGTNETDSRALDMIRDARAGRDISRETFLAELLRYNILSDEFDPQQNESQLEEESNEILGQALLDLDPAQPNDPAEPVEPVEPVEPNDDE
jgi:hypothetical protein